MTVLKIDRPAPGVVRLLINRPQKRNAVDQETRTALVDALEATQADADCRAIVLGGVDHVFSAGGDLPSMLGQSEQQARERMRHGHRACRLIANSRVPVVAAAEGFCAGAVIGLALLSDAVIAGRDTRFLFPFLRLGLVPDWGLLRSLPMRIGVPAARRIFTSARAVSGEEAYRIGLVDEFVDGGDVMLASVERAAALASLSPRAYERMKRALLQPSPGFEADLRREEDDQTAMFLGGDFPEGYAAFTEKRDPVFTALPPGVRGDDPRS